MPQAIHSYRPQRTKPEDLEAIFVGREHLLKDILDRLSRWQPRASRQHYLIIGPRGIGKTNLLRLIEHRIRQTSKLSRKWYPVSIAEDAYGIARVTDLLIEALRILAEDTGEESIKRVYERVRYDDNEARVTDLALDAFRRFHKSKGCGILFMVENVNRVFERQMHLKSEIHLLRKILIEEDWMMTICTSPTYLNAVTQPEEPLFEFFDVKVLAELTPEQQEQMLQKLAALEGNVAFENDLAKYRSQLRALYHFTGGNPRLTIMLYDLVANQSITDVKTELDLLLDQLTPFYQDRMKEIAEQEGKILETMALMPEGCTPTELAKEARMPGEHVRALLARLEKAGYIRREERRRKRTIYIIPERFFRIWHQMNHSRAARGRVQYLLEFFASWYATKEERDQVFNELLECCIRDKGDDVRSNVAAALGRIAAEKPIPDLNQVLTTLIDELINEPQERIEVIIRTLLHSAFRSANLEMVGKTINIVMTHFSDAEAFYAPYVAALEYIQSDKNPAVLERQHPEMRDAIQLLVNIFDEGHTHFQPSKQKRLAKNK